MDTDRGQVLNADLIQTASLVLIAGALVVTAIQARIAGRQAVEAARQTAAVTASLAQAAYQHLGARHDDYRIAFFKDDPALLRWHLAHRGCETMTDEANRRVLYILCELDVHEVAYLIHLSGALDDAAWNQWMPLLVVDLQVPEFSQIWPAVRRSYAAEFVAYVDGLLTASAGSIRPGPADV